VDCSDKHHDMGICEECCDKHHDMDYVWNVLINTMIWIMCEMFW